ncbi:MAG: acyl-CoA dehydrogenase family protein [Novosphingobium sp.]|nr:acyl-CoA dehydrogenase family protein [Novosphingobium sp.]
MRVDWSEEEVMLRDMLSRYMAENCAFEQRPARIAAGFDRARWHELAELGVLGVPFAEADGGSGFGARGALILMEAAGRALTTEPLLAALVGGTALTHGATEAQRAEWLPRLIAGDALFAFAHAEPGARSNVSLVRTVARRGAGGWVLDGGKTMVHAAPDTDWIVLSARTGGAEGDREGISLFRVPRDAEGLSVTAYRTIDGLDAGEVALGGVALPADALLGEEGAAFSAIERTLDLAAFAVCAEALGAIAALNERCLAHCRAREAFGQTLARFQAIQHRLVDMHVSQEQAGALTLKTAAAFAGSDAVRRRMVSACKVQVAQEAAFVGKHAVQLHGAMGMTEELDVGHYFRKLMLVQALFGGSDHHLRRFLAHGEA